MDYCIGVWEGKSVCKRGVQENRLIVRAPVLYMVSI